MAHSVVMPNVASSAGRVSIPAALLERIEAMALRTGLVRDELVELVLRSRMDGPESPAASLWEHYVTDQVQRPQDVVTALLHAGIPDGVRGFQLGAPAPDRVPVPWSRPGIGAELWWTPEQVWPAVRGLFRVDPAGVSVIAALRLGHVLGVYRVTGWAEEPDSGRKYALDGKIITAAGRLLGAETGAELGPASPADVKIHAALTAAPILTPGRQPVVRLSAR